MSDAAPAPAGPDRHVWDRLWAAWHVVYALLLMLTAVLVSVESGLTATRRALALGLLVLLGGWYATTGARALASGSHRPGLVYLAVAGPLTVVLFGLAPIGSLMLITLYPHIWVLLPFRQAMVGTVATAAGVVAADLARGGVDAALGNLVVIVVPALLAVFVAPTIGVWISRVIQQSHQRAELLAELEAARAELAAVSHDAGALAERERLAREIHDTIAQGFTSVLLLLQAIQTELDGDPAVARRHLAQAEQTVREHLAEARSLVALLTPTHLEAASLPEALERLTARFGHERGIVATVSVTGPPRPLPANHEVVLLRVTQEALANVRKHAAARQVTVRLGYGDSQVTLEVGEDGRGFDAATIADGGFGLAGMRARVQQVDCTLDVDSAPGRGTRVTVEVPCPQVPAAPDALAAPDAAPAGRP
jgi:signal transduction histidine kinase